MLDECTYCGTRGNGLAVERQGVFADEWFPEETPWSVVRPGVPACRLCARDVREVQLRLLASWRGVTELQSLDTREAVVGWVRSQCAPWRGGALARPVPSVDPLDVEIMTRRLVRALYRWETGELLPLDVAIQSAQLSRDRSADVLQAIVAQGLERRELQPGIAYWFARASDSSYGSLWYVAIWSRIFLFAKTLGR